MKLDFSVLDRNDNFTYNFMQLLALKGVNQNTLSVILAVSPQMMSKVKHERIDYLRNPQRISVILDWLERKFETVDKDIIQFLNDQQIYIHYSYDAMIEEFEEFLIKKEKDVWKIEDFKEKMRYLKFLENIRKKMISSK